MEVVVLVSDGLVGPGVGVTTTELELATLFWSSDRSVFFPFPPLFSSVSPLSSSVVGGLAGGFFVGQKTRE